MTWPVCASRVAQFRNSFLFFSILLLTFFLLVLLLYYILNSSVISSMLYDLFLLKHIWPMWAVLNPHAPVFELITFIPYSANSLSTRYLAFIVDSYSKRLPKFYLYHIPSSPCYSDVFLLEFYSSFYILLHVTKHFYQTIPSSISLQPLRLPTSFLVSGWLGSVM